MPSVRFEGRTIELHPGETVLDGLLRSGHRVPHSCKAGACQSCLMRAVGGPPPDGAQFGLNDGLKARGYFLSCVAKPSDDLEVNQNPADLPRSRVRIEAIERLGEDVLRVFLDPESACNYSPGQFLTLIRDDGLSRSYSIASLPDRDRFLELHVRVLPDGQMGRWLGDEARPGDLATIPGPAGHCFYTPGHESHQIILGRDRNGARPLRDRAGCDPPRSRRTHHLIPRGPPCRTLSTWTGRCRDATRVPQFHYVASCLHADGREDVEVGRLETILHARFPVFTNCRVYLCGNPAMVQALRKQVFLEGGQDQGDLR